VVEVTGLRNPCVQLDKIQKRLIAETLDRDAAGNLVRKAGIMGIVLISGEVRPAIRFGSSPFPRPGGRSTLCEPIESNGDGRAESRYIMSQAADERKA
jgi:hypothetical protein